MMLRKYDGARGWNLGAIKSSGTVSTDWLSAQADGVGLSDISKQYLRGPGAGKDSAGRRRNVAIEAAGALQEMTMSRLWGSLVCCAVVGD